MDIEELRNTMYRVATERGSLTHPDVVALSEQLDDLIVVVQRRRLINFLRDSHITYAKGNSFPLWQTTKSRLKYSKSSNVILMHV